MVDRPPPAGAPEAEAGRHPRLEILKALGDNTRYAIFLELARSPRPLSTADVAESLDLHPNTVRPHLERMRDLGLLDLRVDASGAVGRPQHLYSPSADAPSLGLEPPSMPTLARMLVRAAADAGLDTDAVVDAGRAQGQADGAGFPTGTPCAEALMTQSELMGFDPEVDGDQRGLTVAFTHCPYRDLAEANPELVCGLHQGMVEGLVGEVGGADARNFRTLVDRTPCQVDLVETG
jgi:predicted ArsR family transcriptional regulator